MNNPGLDAALWAELDGRLWHATSPSAWNGILADSAIRIFNHRYRGAFSKRLLAVSLLDFGATAKDCGQFNNWTDWLGHQQKSRVAVWLEIDRAARKDELLDAGAMHDAWQIAEDKPMFIPGVEACHRGDLPISALVGALLIGRDHGHPFRRVALNAMDISMFEASLKPEPPESDLARVIRESLDR